jgi:hypothetical protein
MKCEIKLCPLLIIDHIESVYQTLLMFVCANFLHLHFYIHLFVIIHFMLAWDLFVKHYDECFHIHVNACRHALLETNWFFANGNPTLCTPVVVPGGLPRANPCLNNTRNPYKKKQ